MKKTTLTIVLAALCLIFGYNARAQQPAKPQPKPKATQTDTIKAKQDSINLNEVQIIGYGQTTRRLNTGSVSSISAKQIETQPVTSVLSALSGRMPGVFVQTTNGLPGGNINIQIRGRSSIAAGSEPLYIIDGVPFESNIVASNANIATVAISGAMNPLNTINPADIENITVLKDADATAIYGSRGTNGVILISTKKGKAGKTKTSLSISQGFSNMASLPKMLSTPQYLEIRKEAFANDKITPDANNAPDLLLWDQTQQTNWPEYLFGRTASATDIQAGVSGGNTQTTFRAAASFHQEGNVISTKAKYRRGGINVSLNHRSDDGRFDLQIINASTWDVNLSPNLVVPASAITLPPNQPLYDELGNYYWRLSNPLAEMESSTDAASSNLNTNVNLGYALSNQLRLSISSGYNKVVMDQTQLFPTRSQVPGNVNYAQYGLNSSASFIIEPQLDYRQQLGQGNLTLLLGATYQIKTNESSYFKASNFSNEELMENIASATTIDIRSTNTTAYKYASIFSRATYALKERYVLNATFRRDGSSRFGRNHRFGNFGSVAAAWIFTEEDWVKRAIPVLSFGKLRTSYGITGNDKITDYQFLSTYSSSGKVYQGIPTLNPSRIENANFQWETTGKLELALESGWLRSRILLNVNYYQGRSDDQLVLYTLPYTTGFPSYQANLPAVVENKGWEMELVTVNIQRNFFSWNTAFNLTLPLNRLLSFENFDNSSYRQTYEIGYDLNRIKGYQFLGLDTQTGKAQYAGENGLPGTTPFANYTIGKGSPDFFGGLSNTFTYKGFSLDVFLQYSKQMSMGGIRNTAGISLNNYAYMLKRWQQPGDETNVPKASTVNDSFYTLSSANFFDASYLRLKTLSLAYTLPQPFIKRLGVERFAVNLRAQNLATFWNRDHPLMDPESGAYSLTQKNLSPGRTLLAGFDLTF